jgi:uncharacterized protein (TIGR02996 family)
MDLTTEDDFQNAIDREPKDWHTRLVFADWLDDQSDPRASGYRAIAVQRRYPLHGTSKGKKAWWWHARPQGRRTEYHNVIPTDWFALLPPGEGNSQFWPVFTENGDVRTRRECEDALAFAFAKLPMPRRAELLTSPPVEGPGEDESA